MAVRVSVSPLGALVGAVVGAIVRPAAVYLQIGDHLPADAHVIYAGSAVIGLIVGALSGLVGKPLWGAAAGGILAVLMYFFSVIPLAFCLCLDAWGHQRGGPNPPSWWLIACTGVVAGGSGGLAEWLVSRNSVRSRQAGAPDPNPAGKPDAEPRQVNPPSATPNETSEKPNPWLDEE